MNPFPPLINHVTWLGLEVWPQRSPALLAAFSFLFWRLITHMWKYTFMRQSDDFPYAPMCRVRHKWSCVHTRSGIACFQLRDWTCKTLKSFCTTMCAGGSGISFTGFRWWSTCTYVRPWSHTAQRHKNRTLSSDLGEHEVEACFDLDQS